MSYGYDEFESKVGQFIYTMVMYERLRDYLLEKLRGKDRLSLRLSLGTDKSGNHVFMDVLLTSVRPQIFVQMDERKVSRGKHLIMVMSNEEVSGDSRQIAMEMEKLIVESLKWWHGYFGERDKLRLGDWRTESVSVVEGEVMETVVEIPVSKIIVTKSEMMHVPESKLAKLTEVVDILPPIRVRPNDSGYYELVSGAAVLSLHANHLGRDKVKAVVVEAMSGGREQSSDDLDAKIYKLLELLA